MTLNKIKKKMVGKKGGNININGKGKGVKMDSQRLI